MTAPVALLLAALALAAWIVTGFVLAIPAGWPHLFLVGAVWAAIAGIVAHDARRAR